MILHHATLHFFNFLSPFFSHPCVHPLTIIWIALNILRGGGVLNTPVGQLIISAAVM